MAIRLKGLMSRIRPWRKQLGYLGIGNRRGMNGGQSWEQYIAALLSGAPVQIPLTHTAIPERGDITPSFTRATTATGQKWDEAGYLDFTALAGEIVWKGARRERNLFTTSSENFSSGWTTTNSIVVTTSGGGLPVSGGYAEFASDVGSPRLQQVASPLVVGNVYVWSFYVLMSDNSEPNTATAGNYRDFTLVVNGGDISNYSAITNTDVGDSVWRVSYKFTATITTLPILHKYAGLSTATALRVSGMQINDITGETDQTTIRPYVSVGVESAPAYHGSMVDGVRCYDTDRSGNPISTSGSYPLVGYVPWEARTNLCIRSQEFDNAAWAKTNGGAGSVPVVTANQAVAPDGTTTADKVVFAAPGAGDISAISSTAFATVIASSYTSAVYVKAFAAGDIGKQLLTRHVGTTSYTAITLSADWQRLGTTEVAAVTSTTFDILLRPTFGGSSGTVSCYLWQADVQLGTFITPAIPTTTVAVARNADVLTYTGAGVANIKTLAATFSRGVGVSIEGDPICIGDGTTNNYGAIYMPSTTELRFVGAASGSVQWNTTASNAYTPGATSKIAFSMATNDIKMDKDGVAQTADTVATVPVVSQINVGHIATLSVFNGPVNHIYGWTRNLSQSELGAIDRA